MRCGLSRRRPVSGKKRILFLAAAFTALLVFFLECRLKPVLEEITKNEASALSVEAVNTAVNEALQEKGASYENLVQIERNNSGEILAVSSNVVQMNQLKADILKKAQESLKDFGHMDIKVPIGTLLGGELLHGRGPEIPVRITLTGNITADFASNFESAGINQTKHQIIMKLNIHIYTYLSGAKAGADLTSSVPIAETVIVGETPQFFATAKNAQSKDS